MEFDDIMEHTGNKKDELIVHEMLVSSKSAVRAYSVALTETISPEVRDVLRRQLTQAINQHSRIADYMVEIGAYHPYDLKKQVKQDKKKVKKTRKIIAKSRQPENKLKKRRPDDSQEASNATVSKQEPEAVTVPDNKAQGTPDA
ncbi:hypothetical protein GCM10022378_17270 [Salinicoccus jeotgali]|uniref:Spore coat protein n=1 Tax=Salinicoccus jeotgali TaxID=381634 RepID=A0ABP7F186_9STAP